MFSFRSFGLLLVVLVASVINFSEAQCSSRAIASTDATCTVCPKTYTITLAPGGANLTLPMLLAPGTNGTSSAGLVRIDMMLVYDTSLAGYTEPYVGFATCNTRSASSYSLVVANTLTNDFNQLGTRINQIDFPQSNQQSTPIFGPHCIRDAMRANVGWRSNAFRVVALLSANPMFFTYDLTQDIYDLNIVPLFYMATPAASTVTAVTTYANSLPIAFFNVGSQKEQSKRYQGWSQDVASAIDKVVNFVNFGRTSEIAVADTFIFTIPPRSELPLGGTLSTNVTIGYPAGLDPTIVPTVNAEVTAYGYGSTRYLITVVQPPFVFPATYTSVQLNDVPFTISVSVPSGQSLTAFFSAINNGDIYETNLVTGPMSINTAYYSLSWVFRPLESFYGVTNITLYVYDGCQYSKPATLTFNITRANVRPVASSFSVTVPYNSVIASQQRINFTSHLFDANDGIDSVSVVITSFPSSALGVLIFDNGSALAIPPTPFTLGLLRTIRFVPNAYRSGTTSFTYTATDGLLTSLAGTVTVSVPFNNTIPTLTATATSFSGDIGSTVLITLTARDQDLGEQLALVAISASLGLQSLTVTNPVAGGTINNVSTPPFTLLANRTTNSQGFVFYTLRWTVAFTTVFSTQSTVSLVVFDMNGGVSAPVSIGLSVNPLCNAGFYLDTASSSCLPCQDGFTSSGGVMTICSACSSGTYSNATTGWICSTCTPGQVPSSGQGNCTSCPEGTYQVEGSCVICAPGSTSAVGSTSCSSCNSSTYSDYNTIGICVFCPDGSVPNATLSGCVACPAGYKEVNDVCVTCEAGNSSLAGSTSCGNCPEGFFSSASSQYLCVQCPAGTYSNVPTRDSCPYCPAGYTSTPGSANNASQCVPCSTNTYSDPALTLGLCVSCPPGYVPDGALGGSGNTTCAICPAGTYSVGDFCQSCPDGSQSQAGSFSLTQCSNCTVGYYANATTNAVCEPCPAGTYSLGDSCEYCPDGTTSPTANASSPLQCTPCPTDSYSTGSGTLGSCSECPNGTVPNAARTACVVCRDGYYESLTRGTCTICPNGTTSVEGSPDSTACSVCPPGQTSSPVSDGTCFNCSAQTYSDANGICQPCPPGSISPVGSSVCNPCPAGLFAQNGACVLCPVGFTSADGSTNCTRCPDGSYSNSTTLGLCNICPAGTEEENGRCVSCAAGTISTANSTSCVNCDAGTYSSPTFTQCLICPNGTTSAPGGASSANTCTRCPDGTYSNLDTLGICTSCPYGFRAADAQDKCVWDPRPPVLVEIPAAFSFNQGTKYNVTLAATDPDVDDYLTLRMTLTSLPVAGPVTFDGSDVVQGTPFGFATDFEPATNTSRFRITLGPDAPFFGPSSFSYEAVDRNFNYSDTATVSFNVIHVNHAPETSDIFEFGLADSAVRVNSFTFTDFDGSLDSHSLLIETLPGLGTLSTSAGSSLQSGSLIPASAELSWSLLFTPPAGASNEQGPFTSFTFRVCDNSMDASTNCSAVATATIFVAPINRPPFSWNQNVTTFQNNNVQIQIAASDPDSWDAADSKLSMVIVSMSGEGSFFLDENMTVPAATFRAYYPRSLWYRPPRNVASPNAQTPLASFVFQVVDGNGTISSPSNTFSVYVTHVPQPPEFVGQVRVTVQENAETDILLATTSQFENTNQLFNGSYTTTITSIPTRGSLAVCSADGPCSYISQSGVVVAPQSEWVVTARNGRVTFIGDLNSFGYNYTFFEYRVTDNVGQSAIVRIFIDVEHINQPPFFFNETWVDNSITMNENGTALVTVAIGDVDSDPAGSHLLVTTRSTSSRLVWTLYSCLAGSTATNCIRNTTAVASSSSNIVSTAVPVSQLRSTTCDSPAGTPVTDFSGCFTYFALEFAPEPRRWSYQYAQLFLQARDAQGRTTAVTPVFAVVLPLNDAPTISAPARVTGAAGVTSIQLAQDGKNVQIDDFDASRADILGVTFELESGVSGSVDVTSNAIRCATISTTTTYTFNCNGTLGALNTMLAGAKWRMEISNSSTASLTSTLKISVTDYGATSVDNAAPQSSSTTMIVEYNPGSLLQQVNDQTNWWWLVFVIIGAILLILAIALIIRYRRSRFPEADDSYFNVGVPAGRIQENPMFKPATVEGFNKLFQDSEEPMDTSHSLEESGSLSY